MSTPTEDPLEKDGIADAVRELAEARAELDAACAILDERVPLSGGVQLSVADRIEGVLDVQEGLRARRGGRGKAVKLWRWRSPWDQVSWWEGCAYYDPNRQRYLAMPIPMSTVISWARHVWRWMWMPAPTDWKEQREQLFRAVDEERERGVRGYRRQEHRINEMGRELFILRVALAGKEGEIARLKQALDDNNATPTNP